MAEGGKDNLGDYDYGSMVYQGFDLPVEIEYDIAHYISLYITPLLLCCGIIGNILIIMAMFRLGCTTLSSCFYFALLGIIDLFLMCLRAGNDWTKHAFNSDITTLILSQSNVSCQVYSFLTSLLFHLCSWVLVVALVEYAMVSVWPEKAHSICTAERVKNVLLVVVLFLICVNAHFFWTYGLVLHYPTSTTYYCSFTQYGGYYSNFFRENVWPVMDNLAHSFIPLLVIITCLVLKATQARMKYKSERLASNHFINTEAVIGFGKVCIVLGISGIIMTMPETINNLFEFIIEKPGFGTNDQKFFAQRTLALSICCTIRDLYLCGKIIIYLVYWRNFRMKVVDILKCRRFRLYLRRRRNATRERARGRQFSLLKSDARKATSNQNLDLHN